MAITSVDDIAAGLAAPAQRIMFFKTLGAAKAAGTFQSSWLSAGFPGAGSAPVAYTNGSGYTADDSTAGAPAYANASTQNYLARIHVAATVACTFVLVDRLWSCSGMGFAASTYSITTPGSLPARITDNGVGVEAAVENFVAAGAASGTATLTYVEPGGGTGHTGVIAAVQSAPVAGQMQLFPLQAGDTGIKQVTNVITSNTWTSGSFGVTLYKRIIEIPLPIANCGDSRDWAGTALVRIPSDACLMGMILASTTTAATVTCSMDIIDK